MCQFSIPKPNAGQKNMDVVEDLVAWQLPNIIPVFLARESERNRDRDRETETET